MKLRYHSDPSSFFDEAGNLYPEPTETIEILNQKLNEAHIKLKSLPAPQPACEYSDEDDDMFFDLGIARFNLCNLIENLEWKIDLKLFYTGSK